MKSIGSTRSPSSPPSDRVEDVPHRVFMLQRLRNHLETPFARVPIVHKRLIAGVFA